jgi:hypothetical protein
MDTIYIDENLHPICISFFFFKFLIKNLKIHHNIHHYININVTIIYNFFVKALIIAIINTETGMPTARPIVN